MERSSFETLFRKDVFDCSSRLDRVTEDDGVRVVFALVAFEFFHQQLKWLDFVKIADVDKLMLQVAQIQMSRFLH